MHDGRFETLEEVIEHYSRNIQPHVNLSHQLRKELDQPLRFNYSEEEKKALVDYLRTLTDEEFLTDVRFSNPFK